MMLTNPDAEGAQAKSQANGNIIQGQFVEILPDTRIVEAVQFDTDDSSYNGVMTITTVLEPLKDGTKVTLIAEDVPPGIGEAEHRAGMDATLRNLANFVE